MTAQTDRLGQRFAACRAAGRGALVTYVTAGDPDPETSQAILDGLPGGGADLVELGMPFTDPMADGPEIQLANQRALAAGQTLARTLDMVAQFRTHDTSTPLVLMGYYNPIYRMGVARFLSRAVAAGVDGLIIVDLPPEEDSELCLPARAAGLPFIRLVTPTTDDARLPSVLANSNGFLYYVSVTGITGSQSSPADAIAHAVTRLRGHTALPIAVGFGIRTPAQAGQVARVADGAVVGSAVIETVRAYLDDNGRARSGLVSAVTGFVSSLAEAVRGPTP